MAKKWSEVASSPEFQALPADQQEAARGQYFEQVIAPQVPEAQRSTVRQQFDADTGIKTLPTVQAERPDFSGVSADVDTTANLVPRATREQRQAHIAAADQQLNYDDTLAGLNTREQIGRSLGLGGRAILKGLAAIPDIVVAPATAAIERFTTPQTTTADLVTGRAPQGVRLATIGDTIDQAADYVGAPRPQNAQERVASDITSAISGGATGIGLGNTLARSASPVVSGVGNALASNAGAQLAGAATGTGAAGVTREMGGSQGAQIAAGLAGALAPGVATSGIPAAVGSIVPEARKELARRAQALGVTLTPAQLTNSRFLKYLASVAQDVPLTGARGRAADQVADFNRALTRTVGQDAPALNSETFNAAKADTSALYDSLVDRNTLQVDDRLIRRMDNIANTVIPTERPAVDAMIDAIYQTSEAGKNGVRIPGRSYQQLYTTLGEAQSAGGAVGNAMGNLKRALQSAMDDSITPADQAAWRQANREYANRKALTPLVAKADEEGMISPVRVLGAATSNAASKEAMAAGNRGDLGTLARAGQLMREPPNSGTSQRGAILSAVTGAGALADPISATAGLVAARLISQGLDSRVIARMLINQNPGMSVETANEIIRQAAIPAAIATEQTQ